VVFSDPPFEETHPRVTVVRYAGQLNAGDGRQSRYAVRYVVDCETRLLVEAVTAAAAARRSAAVVRERLPRAVWLLDVDRTTDGTCVLDARTWQPLARAADEVQAAFVAWTGPTDDAGA
jgi:hypothetical protein